MGVCFSSNNQSPSTTAHFSSGTNLIYLFGFRITFLTCASASKLLYLVGISQTTSNTTSSSTVSNVSGNSQFSAASGGGVDEVYPNGGQILPHPNLRTFSFTELKTATRNFRSDTVLGEGGFGKVYKGWLDDRASSRTASGTGTVIAVKKLNSESLQGLEEWQVNFNYIFSFSTNRLSLSLDGLSTIFVQSLAFVMQRMCF